MSGVLNIVTKKLGEGGVKNGPEVKRVQQLLYLAGFTKVGTPDGGWGKNTGLAWQEFQEKFGYTPAKPFVEAGDADNKLFYLALSANVLVPLPSGDSGASGMKAHFESARTMQIPYGWAKYGNGTMMTWGLGLNGNTSWAICTRPGGRLTAEFDIKVPRASNCTAFANVLMSIWAAGNLHNPKYSASQDSGGADPSKILGKRYGFTTLPGSPKPPSGIVARAGLYTSLDELKDAVMPGQLYHFAICDKTGFISHDTVLLDGEIYECNCDKTPACYKSSLDERWQRMSAKAKYAIVSGMN